MDLKSSFSLITFLSSLLFIFLLFNLVKKLKRSKTKNTTEKFPPGPWKLPLIGNIFHLVGSLPHRALRDLARKHGPLMHLQLGEISTIVISSPRVAKEALKAHDLALSNRPQFLAAKMITYEFSNIVLAPYGEYWRQMRKICNLELLSTKKVQSFHFIREDEVSRLIASIHSSSGSSFNLTQKIFSMTSTIICRAAFGKRCNDQDALVQLNKECILYMGGFDIATLFPSLKLLHVISGTRSKLLKITQKIDQILDNIIEEHKERTSITKKGSGEAGDEDLVDVLLRLKESGSLEFPITSNNIKAVILDMFGAGTDTSSTTTNWAMSEMIRNPRVMEKAQAEVRQALKGKRIIKEVDIQRLNYLKLVIKETLRLHPPAALLVPRECKEQCEIDGYNIPIQTKIIINAWAIGRDPEYWKDPESFEPERFDNNYIDFTGNNFEYIPFGAGRRICPGMSFGLANVELALAQLLYHFNWTLPKGMKREDLDMSETFGANVGRKTNLYLCATSHSPL